MPYDKVYDKFLNDFSNAIIKVMDDKVYSNIIILCIGTDRVIGDSFGPIVGYKLKNIYKDSECVTIIGDLENPVCSNNINTTISNINANYKNPFIIAIDSALANKECIGKIIVSEGGLCLATGVNNQTAYVGDISIKAVVAQNLQTPKNNFAMLQNIPLSRIIKMADIVSTGICNVIE